MLKQQSTGILSYKYSLSLYQDVALDRDPTFVMSTPTWHKENLGYAGSHVAVTAIREAVSEIVDKFCNDFLAANSKP